MYSCGILIQEAYVSIVAKLHEAILKEAFHDIIEISSFAVVAEELPHQNSPCTYRLRVCALRFS